MVKTLKLEKYQERQQAMLNAFPHSGSLEQVATFKFEENLRNNLPAALWQEIVMVQQ